MRLLVRPWEVKVNGADAVPMTGVPMTGVPMTGVPMTGSEPGWTVWRDKC